MNTWTPAPPERLYYTQKYVQELTTTIVDVQPEGTKFGIRFEQTIFFPEGGGQPGDQGWIIVGTNQFTVETTIWKENHVVHIVNQKGLEPKMAITAKIDWNHRFEYMQVHTAQHLLSASFLKLFEIESGSIHFGKDTLSLDLKSNRITPEHLEQVELEINKVIYQNIPVETHLVTDPGDLDKYTIRGQNPKIKANDPIRIVEISNYDYSPCGGLHVDRTGEIGIIKITKITPIKDLTRIEYTCGQRAVREWQQQQKILGKLSSIVNANGMDLIPAIQKMHNDAQSLKSRMKNIQNKLITADIVRLLGTAIEIDAKKVIIAILEDYSAEMLKILANVLTRDNDVTVLIATLGDGDQPKVTVIFARPPNHPWNMNELLKNTIGIINGKGGGKPEFAQGMGEPKNIHQLMDTAHNLLLNKGV